MDELITLRTSKIIDLRASSKELSAWAVPRSLSKTPILDWRLYENE